MEVSGSAFIPPTPLGSQDGEGATSGVSCSQSEINKCGENSWNCIERDSNDNGSLVIWTGIKLYYMIDLHFNDNLLKTEVKSSSFRLLMEKMSTDFIFVNDKISPSMAPLASKILKSENIR
ncbi:hypothetical protein TNCV_2097811 [Trichonephila clavipes]|nr:hypothetical protein TNCV_2097811 [Trichonephila clavipes]